ncbi:MAG: pirin family protein [Actinobacteria bacterium]|nr:MAG: pirin family protein [Actinomycetota bacterium]
MLQIRRDTEIHAEEGGWFSARWHFSFDRYRDPDQMGIGPLRVFNDDRLVAGADWPMHPHADVEGLTYVVEGTFEHADSLGQDGTLQPGGVQRMTLGSGARHSERNGSKTEPMRFLQFWILPDTPSLPPSVEQRQFTREARFGKLLKVIGREGGDVVAVHQDASAYVAALEPGAEVEHGFKEDRAGYLYLIAGAVRMNEDRFGTGDAAKIFGPEQLSLAADEEAELILIDVPQRYAPVGVWARGVPG